MVPIISEGQHIILNDGYQELPELPVGEYMAFYVAKRHGLLRLPEIKALSADSYDVKIEVDFTWKTTHPKVITKVQEPLLQFTSFCEAATKAAIREYPHHDLVGTANNTVQASAQLCEMIRQQIGRLQHRCGISVVDLNIRSLHGDAAILEPVKEYVTAQSQKNVIEINGEIKKLEKEYEFLVESIRQQTLALESARDNYAQEPQRQQERILHAIDEISRMATLPMRLFENTNPGYQASMLSMDLTAFARAMEHGFDTISKLALSSTLPQETNKAIEELLENKITPLKGNGRSGVQFPGTANIKPFRDPSRKPPSNEGLAS
jgi:hypothetical protein